MNVFVWTVVGLSVLVNGISLLNTAIIIGFALVYFVLSYQAIKVIG